MRPRQLFCDRIHRSIASARRGGVAAVIFATVAIGTAGGLSDASAQDDDRFAPHLYRVATVPPSPARTSDRSTITDHPRTEDAGACTPLTPGCPRCMAGVDCQDHCGAEGRWQDMRAMNFDPLGPGGYAGPARYAHMAEYRIRPLDRIRLVYLVTRRQNGGAYRLTPGDEVFIESQADVDLARGTLENGLTIQPDGTITVRLLGEVHAAGLTIGQLREVLERQYQKFYNEPTIDVTPVRTNTLAEDIRAAIAGAGGFNSQQIELVVMPDGKIRVPKLGSVCVQGMTLSQIKREINLRYGEIVVGLEIEPILLEQAPHFIHVMGRVGNPGRIQINTPTTVLGMIAAAGGPINGGNLRQVVVFRRAEDWRLVSTMLDLNGAVLGKRPTPADEIWVQDGDVIIVPDRPIQVFDNWVQLVFRDGVYGVVPFGGISYQLGDRN